jgi:putative transposase
LARQARSKSELGIYHVMLRGNERKSIFLDEEDKNRFVEIMLQKKEVAGSHLYAYCIMDNHVHMVIRELENGQPLETLMKRIGVTYALYFNKKYKRVGHVFQDRFRSEIIEDESYLLSVIRFVHKNPVQSEMVQGLNYSWSSYHWYIGFKKNLPLPAEMEDVLGQFSQDRRIAVKRFVEFHQEEETRAFLDVS